MQTSPPNVLFLMTDQQRFDTIAGLGNRQIYTPNLDRLVRRGISFTNAYSTCPVCVPARYTIRTGCEPVSTGIYDNGEPQLRPDQAAGMEARCGPYLARTMGRLGYRTFGVGKFHASPVDEDLGYDVRRWSEELYGHSGPWTRERDAYAAWLMREYPAFAHVEQLMGERSEMYFQPQTSLLPAELGVESWAADRAVELLKIADKRPWFGFVSFVGPHPPLAPPIPFNRMYDPDRMPGPVRGRREIDHLDPFIPAHAHEMFADELSDWSWKLARARYYGEISYIDQQIGRILDAVEARGDSDNTLIAFFSDHGEMMGDHRACQKTNFFEPACHVPLLLSWPGRLPADTRRDDLMALTDLFAIATGAAGRLDKRQGVDVLGLVGGQAEGRDHLVGLCGWPGKPGLRVMVRRGEWKYIFIANGGGELLFNVSQDPSELSDLTTSHPSIARELRKLGAAYLHQHGVRDALAGDDLRAFPPTPCYRGRCPQMAGDLGITGFPLNPADALTMRKPAGHRGE